MSDSIPPLKNARHERFARELAGGATPAEAWERAGYARSGDAGARAARLAGEDGVRRRVEALRVPEPEVPAVAEPGVPPPRGRGGKDPAARESPAVEMPPGPLTMEAAMEVLAVIAGNGQKDSDRIAACRVAGGWLGWDKAAETAADGREAEATARLAEFIANIRRRKPVEAEAGKTPGTGAEA